MEALDLSRNISSLSINRSHLVYLERGHITIRKTAGNSVISAPLLALVPARRNASPEIIGSNWVLSWEEQRWQEVREVCMNKGMVFTKDIMSAALSPKDGQFVNGIFTNLQEEKKESRFYLLNQLQAGGDFLLTLLYRRRNAGLEDKVRWSIGEAVSYVEANYSQSFALEEIAARCAMNTSLFSRSFKEETGYPLFEYINRVKIRHACALLKRSSLTVLEISLELGYNNITFFNRYFKKVTGMNPSEFRKLK
jgi:YesN/AraC family two-component response regulator